MFLVDNIPVTAEGLEGRLLSTAGAVEAFVVCVGGQVAFEGIDKALNAPVRAIGDDAAWNSSGYRRHYDWFCYWDRVGDVMG
jgi:hypothetical protein